jgi:hypothetical protein
MRLRRQIPIFLHLLQTCFLAVLTKSLAFHRVTLACLTLLCHAITMNTAKNNKAMNAERRTTSIAMAASLAPPGYCRR